MSTGKKGETMNSRIMFGSPEAKAILDRDKEKQRLEALRAAEEAQKNDIDAIHSRINELESEIAATESLLAELQHEVDELYRRRRNLAVR